MPLDKQQFGIYNVLDVTNLNKLWLTNEHNSPIFRTHSFD